VERVVATGGRFSGCSTVWRRAVRAMNEAELEALRDQLAHRGQLPGPVEVGAALRSLGMLVSDSVVRQAVVALRRDSVGAGPLDPLLKLPGVTDVLVNGPEEVYLDRGQGLEPAGIAFADEAAVRRLAVRLAASVARRLDEGSPFVDARLPNGVRVHAVLGCVTDHGTCLSLRVPNRQRLSLDDWVASGSLGSAAAELLAGLIEQRRAFLISGGTGTGKTTLLAALLGLVPANERIVIAEDSRELQPDHPHCLRLESRPANAEGSGSVTLTDLVRQALRMRPDRLVVGEVRGAELADLLSALNTGHEGGCGTVHANSAGDVPARLEALGALGGLSRSALHAQLGAALQVLVHVRRLPDGRRWVEEVRLVAPDEASGRCRTVPALRFHPGGRIESGPGAATLNELANR